MKSGAMGYADCLVLIPAYNEEESIRVVVRDVREALPGATVLVINDCSHDRTSARAREAGARVLNLTFNLGVGAALQAGYRYGQRHGYTIVARVDADGQHPAGFLPNMIGMLRDSGADIVVGSRFLDKSGSGYQSTIVRRTGIKYLRLLLRVLTHMPITDPTSGFRVLGRGAVEAAAHFSPGEYPEPESLVHWNRLGLKMREYPVQMMERRVGQSSIGKLATLYYFFKVSLSVILASLIQRRR
jgi:glycosyltransferase involved in cell wall biosynthesis